jgi:fimbrial chaperone protein
MAGGWNMNVNRQDHQRRIGQALTGLAFLFFAALAQAGSFSVNPVRVTLSASQTVAAITVRNEGTEPTVVQLETQSWTQQGGQDSLTPSSDVLATPPILTIPPGASRIVRVGLRKTVDSPRETTYRLFLREVPPPQGLAQALRVALLISIPIFVMPANATAPKVEWHAARTHDGQIRIQARNAGTAHVQLGQLDVVLASNGEKIATRNMSEYVLPDNQRAWSVSVKSPPPVGTLLKISSQADTGTVQSDVKLEDDARELTPAAANTASR